MTKNKYTSNRLHDYPIMCDICGLPTWYSESYKLGVYTGRGGLRVCKEDNDAIHYGLVPYKIRAEKPVTDTRTNNLYDNTGITGTTPFDYSTYPTGLYTYTDDVTRISSHIWNEISENWEDININWEDLD